MRAVCVPAWPWLCFCVALHMVARLCVRLCVIVVSVCCCACRCAIAHAIAPVCACLRIHGCVTVRLVRACSLQRVAVRHCTCVRVCVCVARVMHRVRPFCLTLDTFVSCFCRRASALPPLSPARSDSRLTSRSKPLLGVGGEPANREIPHRPVGPASAASAPARPENFLAFGTAKSVISP